MFLVIGFSILVYFILSIIVIPFVTIDENVLLMFTMAFAFGFSAKNLFPFINLVVEQHIMYLTDNLNRLFSIKDKYYADLEIVSFFVVYEIYWFDTIFMDEINRLICFELDSNKRFLEYFEDSVCKILDILFHEAIEDVKSLIEKNIIACLVQFKALGVNVDFNVDQVFNFLVIKKLVKHGI
jgi:hypothetical protein